MHWLQQHWTVVLPWALYIISDALPFLPGKAQGVAQFLLGIGRAIAKGGGKPPVVALLLAGALACSGCPASNQAAKQIAYDAAACAVGQVPAAVQDTVGQAVGSLTGASGVPSWQDFAKGDLLKYGISAAICIVEAAIHDIDAATSAKLGQVAPSYLAGHQLAKDWLAAHGVKHTDGVHARLEAPAARAQLLVVLELPAICDSGTDAGAAPCRAVATDDDFPVELPSGDVHEARASARPSLVRR